MTRATRPTVRRALVGALVLAVATLGPGRPASADPARPGNTRSVVTVVSVPAVVAASVVGGDAFLQLTVARGHEVTVLDYESIAYIRFAADGTVDVNRRSKAAYLNLSRYATGALPVGLDPTAAPDWHRVATGGTYAWHDHRVHWMSTTVAPVQNWTVDLVVDGQPATVQGRFGPVTAPTGWPWWLAVLLVAAAVALVTRRRLRAGALVAVAAGVLALPVVVALGRLPGATWAITALVVAALALAAATVALARRPDRPVAVALAGGTGVALALWGLRRTDVFSHAVLVTSLPGWFDRVAVASSCAAGAGLLAGVVWNLTVPQPRDAPAPPVAEVPAP